MIETVSTWLTPEINQFYADTKSLRFPVTIERADGSTHGPINTDFDRIRMWFGWEGSLRAVSAGVGEVPGCGSRGTQVWHIGSPTRGTKKAEAALRAMIAQVCH